LWAIARESAQFRHEDVTASVRPVAKETTPLCLLLLPGVLEDLSYAERLRELLRSPAVVAVEPPRWGRRTGDGIAVTQARRLTKKLPGVPRVAIVFHPAQYRLARALIGRNAGCELWYGPAETAFADPLDAEHDTLARQRAALLFSSGHDPAEPAFRANAELWDRLEELQVARR
jgi:hypothetical protein